MTFNVEPKWVELVIILTKYKFTKDKTTEETADEIYNLFLKNTKNVMEEKK